MCKGIGNSTPWLILAGSGGVADILVTLMERGCWDTDSVQELLLDTFPNAHHSTDISNWVKLVRAMCTAGGGGLVTHPKTSTCQGLNIGRKVGHIGKDSEMIYVGFCLIFSLKICDGFFFWPSVFADSDLWKSSSDQAVTFRTDSLFLLQRRPNA